MQQMAGNMSVLSPFVFNQFGAYGAYAQVCIELQYTLHIVPGLLHRCITLFIAFSSRHRVILELAFKTFSQQSRNKILLKKQPLLVT